MTLEQAIRAIIANDELSDGEVIDAILEELDNTHDRNEQ